MEFEYSTLISIRAINEARHLLSQRLSEPDVLFPDGSVLYVNDAMSLLADEPRVATFRFRSLARYGTQRYTLAYPSRYAASLKPEGFRCGCGIGVPITIPEINSEYVTLLVCFKEKVSAVFTQYCMFLGKWLDSVAESGIQGEGPVKLADQHLWIDGNSAIIRIRCVESGQQTLNWLYLSHLNFGASVSPVYGVFCVEAMAAVGHVVEYSGWSVRRLRLN